jgi:5-hydroxyisourate hydrolase
MSGISTHVLDLSLGKPAQGVGVRLERRSGEVEMVLATRETDVNGRCLDMLPIGEIEVGQYRLVFDTGRYFRQHNVISLYPEVSVTFDIRQDDGVYHLPLLLSPNGFTTYRGS